MLYREYEPGVHILYDTETKLIWAGLVGADKDGSLHCRTVSEHEIGSWGSEAVEGFSQQRSQFKNSHIDKTKGKVGTRNNIIRKLRNSKWGADPKMEHLL